MPVTTVLRSKIGQYPWRYRRICYGYSDIQQTIIAYLF